MENNPIIDYDKKSKEVKINTFDETHKEIKNNIGTAMTTVNGLSIRLTNNFITELEKGKDFILIRKDFTETGDPTKKHYLHISTLQIIIYLLHHKQFATHSPGLGFEPRQRDPKSLVLPLHNPGIIYYRLKVDVEKRVPSN